MKKELVITFDILQDKLDRQRPNLRLAVFDVPDDSNSIPLKDLAMCGLKKVLRPKLKTIDLPEFFGRQYRAIITDKQIKELLNK